MTVTFDLRHLLTAPKSNIVTHLVAEFLSLGVIYGSGDSQSLKNQQTRGEPQESAGDPALRPEFLTGPGHSGPRVYEALRALETSEAASRGYAANNNKKTAGGDS